MQAALGGLIQFMDVPMSSFSAGPPVQPPMKVDGQRVAVSVCYEDAFGEQIIRALPAATVLANVSDDAWFGHYIAPRQHLTIARMRALETGRPLLRATNTGVTAIIGAHGRVQAEAPPFQVAALTGEIQPRRGMTPYARTGNAPVVILIVVMLAAGGFFAWRCGAVGKG